MADLDTLRPEVADAVSALDETTCMTNPGLKWYATIRAELLRLTDENARLLAANRDAMDHFEQMKAELAALKARIAEAPLEVVESLPGAVGPPWPMDHWIEVRMADPCACVGQRLIGKRVRLVVEE